MNVYSRCRWNPTCFNFQLSKVVYVRSHPLQKHKYYIHPEKCSLFESVSQGETTKDVALRKHLFIWNNKNTVDQPNIPNVSYLQAYFHWPEFEDRDTKSIKTQRAINTEEFKFGLALRL